MADSSESGQTSIRIAQSPEEREAVYRFRYRIYVETMRRQQKYADHDRKMIREPLDENGCIVAAFKGDEVIATLRSNMMSDPNTSYYHKLYRIHLFDGIPLDRMTMTTKLMVAPEYRKTALPLRTMVRMPDFYHYPQNVLFDFIDCNKPLIPFFQKYGWQSYIGWAFHCEYGTVRPMFTATRDILYFKEIGSPFLSIALKHGCTQCDESRAIRIKVAKP